MLPDLVAGAFGFVGAIALSAVIAGIFLNRGRVTASFPTRLIFGAILGLGVTLTEFLPVGSSQFGQLDAVPAGVLASAAFGGIVAAAATALVAEGGLLLKGDLDPWSRLAPVVALVVGVGLARFHRMRPPSPASFAAPAIDALRLRLVRLPEGRWRAVGMLFAATGLFGLLHLLVPAGDIAGGTAFYLLLNLLSLSVILVVLGHFSALTVDDLGQLLASSPSQPPTASGPAAGSGGRLNERAAFDATALPAKGAAETSVPERLALRRTLAEIVSAGQLRWVDAGLTGDVVIDPDLARDVLVDPAQLRTAIDGMIATAVDDSDDGALRVTARAGLSAPKDHLHLILTVSDEGRGTPESANPAVVGPLADDREAAEGGGMAGIAPYRFLAEKMGGTLRAISVPGVGTTSRLELMLRCVAPRPVAEPAPL